MGVVWQRPNKELLKEAWLGGRVGNMSGQTQARAWALREPWQDEHDEKTYGMSAHIASNLYTITPARKKKEHPSPAALSRLFHKIDDDKDLYPGKSDQTKFGPDPALNGTTQAIIAKTAMNMKTNDDEVTFSTVVSHNPKASLNPETNRPVGKRVIYKLLKKRCHE